MHRALIWAATKIIKKTHNTYKKKKKRSQKIKHNIPGALGTPPRCTRVRCWTAAARRTRTPAGCGNLPSAPSKQLSVFHTKRRRGTGESEEAAGQKRGPKPHRGSIIFLLILVMIRLIRITFLYSFKTNSLLGSKTTINESAVNYRIATRAGSNNTPR